MTPDVEVVRDDETVLDAAKKMAREDAGALPVCGADDRLRGMITGRTTENPRTSDAPG